VKAALVALALLALSGAEDDFELGLSAYRAGRFADALAALTRAEEAAGSEAAPELVYDRALSALRAGALAEAETAAQRAALRGGAEFAARRDFLLGNVAFARCDLAQRAATAPGAEGGEYDAAIAQAEVARSAWQRAQVARPDWPAARRNAERAERRLAELEKLRGEAFERKKQREERPVLEPEAAEGAPPPEPTDDTRTEEELRTDREPVVELSAEEIAHLLDDLSAKEQEKLALRRQRREAQREPVEKDW